MYPAEPGVYWSEGMPIPPEQGWTVYPNPPGGRRSILSTGPFRMDPGDVQEIDVALVWSQGADELSSVRMLKRDVASIRSAFDAIAAYGVADCQIAAEVEVPPVSYGLGHYPNPVSETAVVRFELPRDEEATITVYDVLGRRVAELAKGSHSAGSYEVVFDADRLAAGLYLYRLETPAFVGSRTLMIVR